MLAYGSSECIETDNATLYAQPTYIVASDALVPDASVCRAVPWEVRVRVATSAVPKPPWPAWSANMTQALGPAIHGQDGVRSCTVMQRRTRYRAEEGTALSPVRA